MDEQLRIILIIIVSVSIFGLLVFVFVKNYIRNKINNLVKIEVDNEFKLQPKLLREKIIEDLNKNLLPANNCMVEFGVNWNEPPAKNCKF